AVPNNLELLELAKKYEVPVIFGSDAHFSTMIADYGNIMPLAERTQFPDDLVLNYNPEKFRAYLKPTPQK
ncbi:MAG TPA: phosphatase, partial [Prevotella sp.]|nr:phosphatase [Prevotella sp.]